MGHDIRAPRIEREDMTRREAVLAAVYLPVHAVLLPLLLTWFATIGWIEPGETPQEAAEREIQEELDTQIKVGKLFDVVEYDYPDFHLTMYCYLCRVLSGNLTLKEHEAARWLTKETLDQVNWLPADLDLIRKLREEERIWSW